jgi:hypothetical protein
MPSSGTLRRVAFVRTNFSEDCTACIIMVTRFGELGIKLAVNSNRSTLRRILFYGCTHFELRLVNLYIDFIYVTVSKDWIPPFFEF